MINFTFKKFPVVLSLLLVFVLLTTVILATNQTDFFSKASSGDIPKNLRITNITDDSITVSYTTDGDVNGTVLFGIDKNNLDSISLDDRDQLNQTVGKYNAHQITLRGLEANTIYYFSINSGANNYLNGNQVFSSKTGEVIIKNPPAQIPAVGNVTLKNNTNPSEGIVFLQIEEGQELSTLIKNGNYIIPLNSIRNKELNEYLLLDSNSEIKIEAYADNQGSNLMTNISNLSPIRNLELQEDYSSNESSFNPTVNDLRKKISPTPELENDEKQSIFNSIKIFKILQSGQ